MKNIFNKIIYTFLFIFSISCFSQSNDDSKIQYKQLEDHSFIKEENKDIKFEVIYFFSYGCPYCYNFENYIQSFLKNKPNNVSFLYAPISSIPAWEEYTKAFYIAQEFDLNIRKDIFTKVHVDHNKILTKNQLEKYFVDNYKITPSQFNLAYNSLSIKNNIDLNETMADTFNISGTPSLVIITNKNKVFNVSPKLAGGLYNTMLTLLYILNIES